ncbi:MAG TPA: ABC transporter transmembrane domain-containing protein, partial [Polyangiaceae bacterium]
MSTHKQLSDAELFERYLGQPARLPEELRRAVEAAWGGEAVLAYAFSDLDSELRFQASWLVLGERHAAVITQSKGQPKIAGFSRAQIRSVSNQPGLSCRVLRLHGEGMEPPLAELYFTHRQKRGMESVAFVIEQALEGRSVPVPDADALYARSLLDPVRAAQALVTPHKLAVVWRLLGYLRPYRKSVALGTGAAFGITALSMAPPFIIGKLVDRVIGPVQAGKVPPAAMSTIAWLAVGGIALVYLLRQVCVSLRLRLMAELGELVAGDLRDELYDHLHTLSMSFFSRKKTGSLITRVSSDTDRL